MYTNLHACVHMYAGNRLLCVFACICMCEPFQIVYVYVQPIVLGVSKNLNLQARSRWSLFNRIW